MRPVPVKFENAMDASKTIEQKPQHQQNQQPSSTAGGGGAAFSPARRVGARGGPQLFAQKLFTLVEEEDSEIVEWLPDGLAFRVKDIQRFSCEVLEKYFNHSKFTSFQRQLNLYQFKRRKGAHAGAFHHPSFRRGQRHLLSKVRRQKVKRDLAVEARAAQRLARAKGGGGGGGGGGNSSSSSHGLSGRGRTRAAAQADLRTIRRHREIEDEDDNDNDDSEDEEEFGSAHGSRRSALRRRVDSGDEGGSRYTQDGGSGNESSNDDAWPTEADLGEESGSCTLQRFSSGDDNDDHQGWREHNNMNNDWRQQVPGSPERSPRELHHVSTPMTMTSQSEYEHTPNSGIGGLDRTSSVGSSLASSLSFASSPSASSPSHSEMMFHSSSPYQFQDNDYDDCEESGHSDSANNLHSPMSIHSPVDKAVATVQAAMAAHVVPGHQHQHHDHSLSLASVVDASMNGWSSPHQSSSLPHLEQFGWGAANVAVDTVAPWADSSASGVPIHHQASQSSPHQEDFGFIDLFAANWDSGEGASTYSSDNINGGGGRGGGGGRSASDSDAFLKEAQASGVFGGVDDFLVPRGNAGSFGIPLDYA